MTEYSGQLNISSGQARVWTPPAKISAMPKGKPHPIKAKKPIRKALINNIKKLRIELGLTVACLSERSGVSQGQISEMENCTGGWSPESFQAVAEALGTTTVALLDVNLGTYNEFARLWERANPEQRSQITKIAKALIGE